MIESIISSAVRDVAAELAGRIDAHQQVVATRAGGRPLTLLANGDSWFDYPLDGIIYGPHTDVIAQLRDLLEPGCSILNLAHYGDTTTQEMGYTRQRRVIDALNDPANGKFDAILLSGGGNDIAGDSLCIWLNDAADVRHDPSRAINLNRFDKALDGVMACYLDMFALRDAHLPGAPIFAHSYDLPIPDGRGVCTIGPWLKPSLDYRGWTNPDDARAIMRDLLTGFGDMLDHLAADPDNHFVHVDCQGVLGPGEWANELHPNPAGFKKIATRFRKEIAKALP